MPDGGLTDAVAAAPDPDRAQNNLSAFLSDHPTMSDEVCQHARAVAFLFGSSQFLANFCRAHPDALSSAFGELDISLDRETVAGRLRSALGLSDEADSAGQFVGTGKAMAVVREFRLREMLKITLRDILEREDLVDVMAELSMLSEVIMECSLRVVAGTLAGTYGSPAYDAFTVIALGKLGGEELNFSSDVDLMFVYGQEEGDTSGVLTPQGVKVNRISCHEYYCRLGESLTRFLSRNTAEGFCYRVDLRLRPEGQRGPIALPLRGYETYYESWGQAWERAALIRARPVAGDTGLGKEFIETVRPFVYRKYLDFSAIDEISRLKTRIDSSFKKGDIKRGYGGIREVEFFIQALQLIYGGRLQLLRERNTLKALHRLLVQGLIGHGDFSILSDNYRYLRTLEHRLQQLNDVQTHTLPAGESELSVLSRKMAAAGPAMFMAELEKRRHNVRSIYDSLFAAGHKEPGGGTIFDEELSESELRDIISGTSVADIDRAARNIRAIKESTIIFQTLRGRRLLQEILPQFVSAALESGAPDAALNRLRDFARLLGANESYAEIFVKNRRLIDLLIYVFSQSEYLSKTLISRPRYLEMIGWEKAVRKSRSALAAEIEAALLEGRPLSETLRTVKQREEIRLGLLLLQGMVGIVDVIKGLTRTADAILSAATGYAAGEADGLSVIGLGKLGGREISFNSDIDLVFVTSGEPSTEHVRAAEKLLRTLIAYTREGVAYQVDTRLRPEGSKGPLVSSVEGFRKYYGRAAAFWEFQALLKARPAAGDPAAGKLFLSMANEVLEERGASVSASDIRRMRERIIRERSKEQEGYDIKLGPGGIEEIEFMVQYLQLLHCRDHEGLLVQGTLDAVKRCADANIISPSDAGTLRSSYIFYRGLESFLRLRGEHVLKKDTDRAAPAARFMGLASGEALIEETVRLRTDITGISRRYLPSD